MAGLFDLFRFLGERPSELPAVLAGFSLAWAFAFAACWGSFTNVVIARVPEGMSVVRPRSRCPKCGAGIAAYDNIPVLSWVLLRGRCRACKAPISPRYPLIEFLIGFIGLTLVARHGWGLESLELFVFATILVAIAFVDLDTWTVPHPLWIALVVTGFGFGTIVAATGDEGWGPLIDRGIGAAGAGVLLGAITVVFTGILRRTGRLRGDEWAMGGGDPLIMIGIGAYLGWRILPLVLFLASLQGAVVGLVLKARGGLRGDAPVSDSDDWIPPANAVPFGPFLALGALEGAFFGDALAGYLSSLLGLGLGAG